MCNYKVSIIIMRACVAGMDVRLAGGEWMDEACARVRVCAKCAVMMGDKCEMRNAVWSVGFG